MSLGVNWMRNTTPRRLTLKMIQAKARGIINTWSRGRETGRDITVGQLVCIMRAHGLSTEEAAAEFDLPVTQVREAQTYYELHREMAEADAEEEK